MLQRLERDHDVYRVIRKTEIGRLAFRELAVEIPCPGERDCLRINVQPPYAAGPRLSQKRGPNTASAGQVQHVFAGDVLSCEHVAFLNAPGTTAPLSSREQCVLP